MCAKSGPLFLGLGRAELLERGSSVSVCSLYHQHPLNHPGDGRGSHRDDAVTATRPGLQTISGYRVETAVAMPSEGSAEF
jgi:hypothetical protein